MKQPPPPAAATRRGTFCITGLSTGRLLIVLSSIVAVSHGFSPSSSPLTINPVPSGWTTRHPSPPSVAWTTKSAAMTSMKHQIQHHQQQHERRTTLRAIMPSPTDLDVFTEQLSSVPAAMSSSMMLSVDVFDGSTIVDPVVVSSSFWRSLQTQIISALLGQFFAAIVFGIVVSFFGSQLSNIKDFVLGKVQQQVSTDDKNSFIKATDLPKATTKSPDFGKLLLCIAIDIIGSSSELVPLLGEVSDLVWAPIAATILQNLFGSNRVLFFLELTEEILPFTDIIPLATFAWVVDTYFGESNVAELLNLGIYSPTYAEESNRSQQNRDVPTRSNSIDKNGVIDVQVEKFEDKEGDRSKWQ